MRKKMLLVSCLSLCFTALICSSPSSSGKVLQIQPNCGSVCFHSANSFLSQINFGRRLPAGTVLIPGTNGDVPVSTDNVSIIKLALQGDPLFTRTRFGTVSELRREFVAAQLSILSGGLPVTVIALSSQLSCFGFRSRIELSTGAIIMPNSMLNDVFIIARSEVNNPTLDNDVVALTILFKMLGSFDRPGCGPTALVLSFCCDELTTTGGVGCHYCDLGCEIFGCLVGKQLFKCNVCGIGIDRERSGLIVTCGC